MKSFIIFMAVGLSLAVFLSAVALLGIAWTHAPFTFRQFMADLLRTISGKDD